MIYLDGGGPADRQEKSNMITLFLLYSTSPRLGAAPGGVVALLSFCAGAEEGEKKYCVVVRFGRKQQGCDHDDGLCVIFLKVDEEEQ
jgi:hypothetical protein